MYLEEEDIQLMIDIGFTKTQAMVYLALLKLGKIDANSLSKNLGTPRPVVYRTLDELHKSGLVEKDYAKPYKFKATAIKYGLKILADQRRKQYQQIQEKAKNFLQRMQNYKEEKEPTHEYKITIIENKERIIQIINENQKNAKRTFDVISTLPRWLQILHYCYEENLKAVERKVAYRLVIERPKYEFRFPKNVETLLAYPNFKLKIVDEPLTTNSSCIDNEKATFSFFPAQPLGNSPLLVTNHPSFLSMAHDHFEKLWASAEIFELHNQE